jgi:hypothetical protein
LIMLSGKIIIGKTPCLVWQGVFKLQCRLKSAIIMA